MCLSFSPLQTLSDLDNELKYIVDVAVQVRDHYKSESNVWIHFYLAPYMVTLSPTFILVSSHTNFSSSLVVFSFSSFPPLFSFQLNAFDSRHLDEIHFDVRLMAFQKSIKHIKEMYTLDMRYLMVIMHNCFHSFEVSKKANIINLPYNISSIYIVFFFFFYINELKAFSPIGSLMQVRSV